MIKKKKIKKTIIKAIKNNTDFDFDLDVFQCAADAKKSSEGFNDKEDPSAGLMNVSILDKRN